MTVLWVQNCRYKNAETCSHPTALVSVMVAVCKTIFAMSELTSISCVDSETMFLLGHQSFSNLVQALPFQPMPSIFVYENVFQARLPVITIDIECV